MQRRERTIRADLCQRSLGRHERLKTAEIPLIFESIVTFDPSGEPVVDEDALVRTLDAIPGFLTADPSTVLLLVADTAVGRPKRFRAWGKYFNALSLFLYPSEYEHEATEPPHHCHADGCTTRCKPEHLMCARHWRMVPLDLQRAVWRTYRPGQCDDKDPSPEWHVAADDAIAWVAFVEERITETQRDDRRRRSRAMWEVRS